MSAKKEVNGNNNVVQGGKRKNKKTNSVLGNKSLENGYPFYPGNHRIFPTMSDPTLCYPYMNCSLNYEPMSSFGVQQPYSFPNQNFGVFNNPFLNYCKSQDGDFTSLPYVNNDIAETEKVRHLSDPGIANDPDLSDQDNVEQTVTNLVEQVHFLKESNRRLFREIQELRNEVNYLRQQCNSKIYDKEYEPGMLSDVVREIRDAARVREEALLSKVKHMIEERHLALNHYNIMQEKARNNERLGKLEEQMKSLCLTNSIRENGTPIDATSTEQVLELEQDTLALRKELQEVIASKKDADLKIQKLDQLVASLTQKVANNENHVSTDEPRMSSGVSTENCSVTTSIKSSSGPVTRVIMSGPVTSL